MTIAVLLLALLAGAQAEDQVPLTTTPTDIWEALSTRVGGRVFQAAPFAQPCFANASSPECATVQALTKTRVSPPLDPMLNILSPAEERTATASGYTWGQWETCQDTGEQCLLDFAVPTDAAATATPNTCELGSIPAHFIDVRGPDDVIAAFEFSKETNIPLVVKNTGHDFKGRSSGRGSLALWTHNLKDISYDPPSSPKVHRRVPRCYSWRRRAVLRGFQFAEENNLTLVGGSDAPSVWRVGSRWAVATASSRPSSGSVSTVRDARRVAPFKIVTPDGKYRTANACQNEDLFFALRGGGGGTFGVVLEATILAAPAAPVQVVVVTWAAKSAARTEALWALIGEHVVGGRRGLGRADKDEAAASMRRSSRTRSDEGGGRGGRDGDGDGVPDVLAVLYLVHDGCGRECGAGKVGYSTSLTSRLVQRASFATPESRTELLSALMAASGAPAPDAPLMIIQITAPTATRPADLAPGRTSVTPAWREALYHVTSMGMWNWNATKQDIMGVYDRTSRLMDNVRKVTPDAAYLNEADVYEPNHEVSFWGDHYPELATIKMKYDPDRLLDCWQCVGWTPDSERYACYL
ncbi:FAD-binding domain-containing protein [Mycena leptocephala]|nr:FAD-binding domain-containing protein [Mycena leptocephala]